MQRIKLKVTEYKKQQLIQLAEKAANTTVIGKYYKGCELTKYRENNQTVLNIK